MTDEEIKKIYDTDMEVLRETIKQLDCKADRTIEETILLEELKDYRQRTYTYPGLAYYNLFDLTQVVNFKTL